jgi:hypothetical protein
MRFHWLIAFVHILVSAFVLAQAPQGKSNNTPAAAAPSPAPPAGLTLSEADYPFPLEERDRIRDLQHEYDQLEIDAQKMQVKAEQIKARQSALIDSIKLAAFQFAQSKKINLDLYELDPKDIKFVKKKTK